MVNEDEVMIPARDEEKYIFTFKAELRAFCLPNPTRLTF